MSIAQPGISLHTSNVNIRHWTLPYVSEGKIGKAMRLKKKCHYVWQPYDRP